MEPSLPPGQQEGPEDQELPGLDLEELEEQGGSVLSISPQALGSQGSPGTGSLSGNLSYFIFEGMGVQAAKERTALGRVFKGRPRGIRQVWQGSGLLTRAEAHASSG